MTAAPPARRRSGSRLPRAAARAAALGAVLAGVLAGCSAGDPALTATPPPDTRTHPVVIGKQATEILDKIDGALTVPTTDRLAGPYLQMRTVQANQAKLLKTPAAAPVVPDRTRVLVPSSTTWPRFFVAVGSAPQSPTPTLRLLLSPEARKPYALFSQTQMLPGVTLPQVSADGATGTVDPASADGLLRSPTDALTRYADVLVRGAASPDAKSYADNVFTAQVAGQVTKDRTALAAVATVTAAQKLQPGTVFALRTQDGGALVFGQLVETVVLAVKKDTGTLKVADPRVAALTGKSVFAERVVRMSTELLTLYVPPAAAGGTITVVGAQKADLSITGT